MTSKGKAPSRCHIPRGRSKIRSTTRELSLLGRRHLCARNGRRWQVCPAAGHAAGSSPAARRIRPGRDELPALQPPVASRPETEHEGAHRLRAPRIPVVLPRRARSLRRRAAVRRAHERDRRPSRDRVRPVLRERDAPNWMDADAPGDVLASTHLRERLLEGARGPIRQFAMKRWLGVRDTRGIIRLLQQRYRPKDVIVQQRRSRPRMPSHSSRRCTSLDSPPS